MTSTTEGFVYLVVNPGFPGWVKVGKTADPVRRLSRYQTGDPKRAFEFARLQHSEDISKAEWLAHQRLKALGYLKSGEWFEVGLAVAGHAVDEACKQASGLKPPSAHQPQTTENG